MKHFFILFFFLSCIISSQTITIRGKVVNSSDNKPLAMANIVVEEKNIGASTDERGEFSINGEFADDDFLIISYIGFYQKKIRISEISNKKLLIVFLDSKILESQTVLVKAMIAEKGKTPITFSTIKRNEIQNNYTVQDIPEYLSYLPGITFYSEAGNGTGYNYMSIRGFDQRRISISVNGVPQNDPEDHNVYWVDMPDIMGSAELIQVQRGSGSGVIGYPAVGGSVNIITSSFSDKTLLQFFSGLGSYNTRKYSASFSSGLVDDKYSFYAKLSKMLGSGYREKSWIDFNSYHLSAVRYDDKVTSQINIYGGIIEDGLAYTGLPKFVNDNKELRRKNYSYWEAGDNDYSYTLERRPEEIENFSQSHFELMNEISVSDDVLINSNIFLVLGDGFFDYDASWADSNYFRLTYENGYYPSSNPGNALIRAKVENRQWGWIPKLSLKHQQGELIIGGEFRKHNSIHWGGIQYAENLPAGVTSNYRYYSYEGGKEIYNFFAHENLSMTDNLSLLAEVQFAYHRYKIENEKYMDNQFEIDGLYINPRLGLNFKPSDELNVYLSLARVTREPRLKDYYDAAESSGGAVPKFKVNDDGSFDYSNPLVNPETMNSIEIGSGYNDDAVSASINLYYMIFDDEIVKKGQVDRFGQPITGNMDKTIHLGLEFTGTLKFMDHFDITMNGSLSKNYIKNGGAYIEYENQYDEDVIEYIDLSGNRITGFPDITFNGIINFRDENIFAQLLFKYVGEFYSDNYDTELSSYISRYPGFVSYNDNRIDSYFVLNFYGSYEFNLEPVMNNLKLFVQVNNIFDKLYLSYAIGPEYFPAAERNYLAGIQLGF